MNIVLNDIILDNGGHLKIIITKDYTIGMTVRIR